MGLQSPYPQFESGRRLHRREAVWLAPGRFLLATGDGRPLACRERCKSVTIGVERGAIVTDLQRSAIGWGRRCCESFARCLPQAAVAEKNFSNLLGLAAKFVYSISSHADMAQLVEHHLAKVGVAGSSPVVRSM